MTIEERLFRGIWWPAGFGCAAMVAAAVLLAVIAAQLDAQIESARRTLDSLVRLETSVLDAEREIADRLAADEQLPGDAWNALRRAIPTAIATVPGIDADSVSALDQLVAEKSPPLTDALADLARARFALGRSVLAGHEALNQSYAQTHPRLLAGLVLALAIIVIAALIVHRLRTRVLQPLGKLARRLSNLERGQPLLGNGRADPHALRPLFDSCERIAARVEALEMRSERVQRNHSEQPRNRMRVQA